VFRPAIFVKSANLRNTNLMFAMTETSAAPALSHALQTEIDQIFARQQQHQWVVARTSAAERIAKLWRLHKAMLQYRNALKAAMLSDFGKSSTEVDISEIGFVNTEIRHTIRHLRSWMTPRRVGMPLFLIGTASEILYQPKGVCLIISPWNFPINLTFSPLVSAIAAGNCVVLKPSEHTPHTAAVMKKMVAECFPPEEVALFEGDATVSQALTAMPFNHIFFTGSPAVGKHVMRAAAANLASVTLELGGKSPVIVDEQTDIAHAASKIAWLKCMNAGQICIAPDYVLVHESRHDELVEQLSLKIKQFYGQTPEARRASPDYCRMVSHPHHRRVKALLDDAVQRGARVVCGGSEVYDDRFIDPAVLTHVPDAATIWEEEIFGPLLPVRPYRALPEAIQYINQKPQALSMYIFSSRKSVVDTILRETRAGGGAVNDCGLHFYQSNMPFGGFNNSGIGGCHGEAGFLAFSHQRGITHQNRIFPHTNLFLPPYGTSRLVNWLLEGVVRLF
jgi:aldehyde dehydrogenase (NAD+)